MRLRAAIMLSVGALAFAPAARAGDARLPTYCRYEIDLHRLTDPYARIGKAVDHDAITCPFIAGLARTATIYMPRGDGRCGADRLRGLPVSRVAEIDGRTARHDSECSATMRVAHWPAGMAPGNSYLVHYRDPHGSMFGFIDAAWVSGFLARTGAPVFDVDLGSSGPDIYMCFLMLPGVKTGPLGVLRAAGRALPATATQERIAAGNCRAVARSRYNLTLEEGQVASEFALWLKPSADTPQIQPFAALAPALLARAGAKPVRMSRPDWIMGQSVVARSRDGTAMEILGGKRQAMVQMRALSPGICEAVYALAKGAKLFIETEQTDLMVLAPPGVKGRAVERDTTPLPVASAADLCGVLRPGFAEWRAQAPARAADLRDLDGQSITLE